MGVWAWEGWVREQSYAGVHSKIILSHVGQGSGAWRRAWERLAELRVCNPEMYCTSGYKTGGV